jgi:uncharacterized Zn finger protein
MTVEQLGPRQYKVGTHYVDLVEVDCDCGDWAWRSPKPCKHLKAAMLFETKQTDSCT